MTASSGLDNVLIIGAGLAGLTLANYLQRQGISFQVFESDTAPDVRSQGWSISIHFAMKALHQSLPEEAFENFNEKISVNPEEEDKGMSFSFVHANTGKVAMSNQSKPGQSYRANRLHLRNWLMEPVKDKVHWNKQVERFEEKDGKVTAFFSDGTQATGDMLVGADGINSPIASQLIGGIDSSKELLPIRSFGVLRWVTEDQWSKITERPNHVTVLNGKQNDEDNLEVKTFNMFCSLHGVDRSRSNGEIYRIFWSMSRYDEQGVIPQFKNNAEDHAAALALLKKWAQNGFPEDSPYKDLIMTTPDDTSVYPIAIRDRYPQADKIAVPGSRVVLIGDAAHPMTMFKGEGGNHAIVDAANLGEQITKIHKGECTLEQGLETYNSEMIQRGEKAVKESHDSAIMVHTKPELMFQMMNAAAAKHQSK